MEKPVRCDCQSRKEANQYQLNGRIGADDDVQPVGDEVGKHLGLSMTPDGPVVMRLPASKRAVKYFEMFRDLLEPNLPEQNFHFFRLDSGPT